MVGKTSSDSLLARIADLDNLTLAWRKVRSNIATARRAASCGTDEVSVAAFEQQWETNLAELSDALLQHRYQPLPARRVAIARPGGKERIIALLAVRDRIAQRAAQQVLEPIFEAEFLDCSYGFRPDRSTADAIHRVLCYRQAGCTWVFDADIANCFDSLDHGLLLAFVSETIREEPVIDLIHDWLEAGLLEADAGVQQASSRWERMVDRITGLTAGPSQALSGTEPVSAATPDGEPPTPWQQRSLWQSAGSELLLLGLTTARPLVRRTSVALRRLARHPGAKWAAAGMVGLAAVGGAWWALQRMAPRGVGALQGSVLAPLLANAYMHRFDQSMVRRKRNLVRYADDLVICCASQFEAQQAGQEAAQALADLRLRLNPDKTRVVSFEEGFSFLGQRFRGRGLVTSPVQRIKRIARGSDLPDKAG